MQRIVGIALIVIGIILFVLGINEADSVASEFKEFFTGNPSDRAIWFLLGGVAAVIVGIGLAAVPAKLFGRGA